MMKKKNKGKKTLAAVGAVVAAGLTPGIIAATPNAMPVQDPNIGLTALEIWSTTQTHQTSQTDSAHSKVCYAAPAGPA